jgi:hypothetical protein
VKQLPKFLNDPAKQAERLVLRAVAQQLGQSVAVLHDGPLVVNWPNIDVARKARHVKARPTRKMVFFIKGFLQGLL